MQQRTKLWLMLTVFGFAGLAVWLFLAIRPGKVDVNSASFSELDAVPYVTPDVARGIVAGRPFETLDELVRVYGMGEKTLEKVRDYLEVK